MGMTPALVSGRVVVYHGSALEVFQALPEGIARTCITSPPYWQARCYGTQSQVWGGEAGHAHQFQMQRGKGQSGGPSEKQLSNSGSWFDTYPHGFCECGAWLGELGLEPTPEQYCRNLTEVFRAVRNCLTEDGSLWVQIADTLYDAGRFGKHPEIRNGEITGIPWMLATHLRRDGWYLRADCIQWKRNGMTESARGRPNLKDKEYVFWLGKAERSYFDMEAVREPYAAATLSQLGQRYEGQGQKLYAEAGVQNPSDVKRRIIASLEENGGRHLRSVWDIQSASSREPHFAQMPIRLAERCILATSSAKGRCPACRKPWVRVTEEETSIRTVGWAPSCQCELPGPEPDVVLEPFLGTGTSALAARRLGRGCVASELQESYLEIVRRRLAHGSLDLEEGDDGEGGDDDGEFDA